MAHLPLLNAKLPSIVHSVLTELLSYARLDYLVLYGLEETRAQFASNEVEYSHNATFDQIRLALGYSDEYAA